MFTSFIGILLEVLFFVQRINSNRDMRFPEQTDRPAFCEISRQCFNEIDGQLDAAENCVKSVETSLDYAILNKQ